MQSLETQHFIHPALKGRNKFAVITPFQGWVNKLPFSQGFYPWLLYYHPVGVEEPITTRSLTDHLPIITNRSLTDTN